MKLGVSYNLFDGEELLIGSINSIKSSVDYISVVYQEISNLGRKNDVDLIPFLQMLVNQNIIDKYVIFSPDISKTPHQNETIKRNIGLELSKMNNCSHHISMDTDEYYIESEMKWLKDEIEKNDYDSSYCQMLTYYKSSKYILDPPENYYVSIIFKIQNNSSYFFNHPSPVMVDPTRIMNETQKYLICKRNQIQMHHLSHIRMNYRKKLENSSSYNSYKSKIEYILRFYYWWNIDKGIKIYTNNKKYLKVKEIDDIFKVSFDIQYDNNFSLLDKLRYYLSIH